MKSHKAWSLAVIIITVCLIVLVITVNYIVDPLQFYRKAFYAPDFSDQQRYQNPGLAKNYDYETIIIGSSMSENNEPSYVDKQLNTKTLKLSIKGSSIKEQNMIAKLAIDTGKVKNVIWVVDYFGLRGDPDRVREEYGPFPYYLYDKTPLNDIKYLLNLDTLNQVGHLMLVFLNIEKKTNPDLNTLNTWGHIYKFDKELVLKEWAKYSQSGPVNANEYESANIKQNIDKNILSIVKNYPGINFYLYYPPYSVLQHRYYYDKNPTLFENELTSKKYIFEQVGELPNVGIYDFQSEKKWTFELNNYKDLAHHNEKINRLIIDAIREEKYRVTKDNLNEILKSLKYQVESLKLQDL